MKQLFIDVAIFLLGLVLASGFIICLLWILAETLAS